MDRFAMDRAAIERYPGGSKFSDKHSEAPIVVGIHRPREEKGARLSCSTMSTWCGAPGQ
jgi:acetylornithine deacetylase